MLILALGVLAALLLPIAGLRLGGRPAHAQSPQDSSLLLQLAQRLLSQQVPGAAVNGPSASVQLFPGALTTDFPSDVPLPPGSTLIGSDERPSYSSALPGPFIGNVGVAVASATPQPPSGVHVDVVLDVPGSAADLTAFYKTALTGASWSASSSAAYGGIGFLSSSIPVQPATYCRPDDHAQLSITARPTDGGPLDVRLAFDTGFNPQCSPPPTPPAYAPPFPPQPGFGVIPSLQAPAGVTVSSVGGSGGGPNRFGTDSVAVTDMAVADLHSFYAGELTSAGWTQVSTGGGTSLTWSTWSIPDHDDLQGFLYVRSGPASGQRSLHLEVGSTDPSAITSNGGYGYSGYVGPINVPAVVSPSSSGGSCAGLILQPGQSCSGGVVTCAPSGQAVPPTQSCIAATPQSTATPPPGH